MKTKQYRFLLLLLLWGLMVFEGLQAQTQVGNAIVGVGSNDRLGSEVALSADGNIMVVSAVRAMNTMGVVGIYEYVGTDWVQLGGDIVGEAMGDESGSSLDISDDGMRVAIGAPLNDGNGANAGHVRIYGYDGMSWVQLGSDIDGESAGDVSGFSVSLSGDGARVAIGATLNSDAGSNAGHVRVFEYDGTEWEQLGADIDGTSGNSFTGSEVALSSDGDIVLVSAPAYNDNRGAVRVYEYASGTWFQKGLAIEGINEGESVGIRAVLSGDGSRFALHRRGEDSVSSNLVQVYAFDGAVWVQLGENILAADEFEGFGSDIALSASGKRVVIGAELSSEADDDAGKMQVYEYENGVWGQVGANILGPIRYASLGVAVAIDRSGNRVAGGAPFYGLNGETAGWAGVYELGYPTSIGSSLEEGESIRLYPNPTADALFVEGGEGLYYEVLDGVGRLLQKGQLDGGAIRLGLLPRGMYCIRLGDDGGSLARWVMRY